MTLLVAGLIALQSAAMPAAPEAAPTKVSAQPDETTAREQSADARLGIESQGGDAIVVTARRRSESVQRVPLAISVIGGTALAETGVYNVGRLTQLQPSLQFYSTNPRNSAANIRGLGAPFGLTNDGIEQGVGIYVDQVYYSRIASASFDFTDTDRIEIVRGPQGTLYGKNTTAGAINIVTRTPSFTPEARFELSGGNYQFLQGKVSVSGPLISDRLAIRLSSSVTNREGTIRNLRTGQTQNAQDNASFRGQLLFRATPDVDLSLYGDYNLQNPNCCVQFYVRTGATQRPLNRQYAALAAAQGYAVPSTNAFDRVTDVDSPLRARQELGGTSLLVNANLGGSTLTSVTAYRFWDWQPSSDRDFIGLAVTPVSANPSQQWQFTQELRLTSNGDRRLDYLFGAFYFYQKINTQGLQVQGPAASRFLLNPSSANAANPAVLDGLTARNTIALRNTSAALFGKLTWHVTDKLQIVPGLRINYDQKNGSYVSVVTTGAGSTALNADQRGVLAPQSYQPSLSDWNVSGDITAAYAFSRDINGYATYARSYKSGGINLSGVPLDGANNPILAAATVKPEEVSHYELGLKTQFADRRVTVNIAAFWTEIDDYQATVTNGQLGVLRGYLANASKVRTRGIEIDSAFRPTSRLSLYANGAFTDARYVWFVDAPCPPELSGGTTAAAGQLPSAPGTPGGISPVNCDISGQELPGVSKWAFSYGAEYGLPGRIGQSSGTFYLGYDGSYRSRFSSNPSPSRYTYVEGYSLSNFRLGYRTDSGWNLFGWVRNAFDQNYFDLLALQPGNTGFIVGQPADPRSFGITLAGRF